MKSGFTQALDRINERGDGDNRVLVNRIKTEAKIARKTVEALLAAGYAVSVNDGEETTVDRSRNINEIMAAMFSTDEDYLYAHADSYIGMVYFVYGNDGYEVINDYSTSLEDVMAPINAYADALEPA